MEVKFAPELEISLKELAESSGRAPGKLVEDVMADYVAESAETRKTLDSRYDDLESGRVRPIDGERFFEELRLRTEEIISRTRK